MDNLRCSLPPLDALVAFEAAARHESFTRAAEDLSLTQAAVSQRVRQLETDLETALFVRANRRVRLTAQGRALQHTASAALRQIAAAAAEIRAAPAGRRLTLAVDRSIAGLWLPSRLPAFRATRPDAELRIIVSDVEDDCLTADVDMAVIHGDGDWPGFGADLLFRDEVYPVCAPEHPAAHSVARPVDLLSCALLELEDARWNWLDWRAWLSDAGVDAPAPSRVMRIGDYPLLIDAARRGQGVALGWSHLVRDAIDRGDLVRVGQHVMRSSPGYFFARPHRLIGDSLCDELQNALAIDQSP